MIHICTYISCPFKNGTSLTPNHLLLFVYCMRIAGTGYFVVMSALLQWSGHSGMLLSLCQSVQLQARGLIDYIKAMMLKKTHLAKIY